MKTTRTIMDDGVCSVIKMIDNSRKSNSRAAIDICFADVQNNSEISELLAYLTAVKIRGLE